MTIFKNTFLELERSKIRSLFDLRVFNVYLLSVNSELNKLLFQITRVYYFIKSFTEEQELKLNI